MLTAHSYETLIFLKPGQDAFQLNNKIEYYIFLSFLSPEMLPYMYKE